MKLIVFVLAIAALEAAVPKFSDLEFLRMYKDPINEVKSEFELKIIGGDEAEPHSIPYQVFLEVQNDTFGWYCGGSLISQNYVLTAGHCGFYGDTAFITLGAHKITETEDTQVLITSTDIIVHENYHEARITNDVCVIKLPEPLTLTDAIQPVVLPSRSDIDNTFEGADARISGWGLTDGQSHDLSEVLNYVDVTVINNRQCEKTFGILLPSVICTSGARNTGSCNGDSGGPLVANGVQIGVVSFGVMDCIVGYPSGFSRVTRFLDWIETNTDVVIN
ncbi:hypothetical protein Zmor_025799 [Zophobas morio]|uniref:Peptidase S1 domain-containing protein n=2 Tax=Zophobas morio TaxID=2755281 RepID=A0AA38HUU4_9CUCU|nr:hypothetical protein Zmor_025799 [Zophobas morio]